MSHPVCSVCYTIPCVCKPARYYEPDHGDKFERIAKALERLVEILEEEQKPGPVITGMG